MVLTFPPFALNVTITDLCFHCAYTLCAVEVVTTVLSVTCVPPVAAVYQPKKSHPVFVGVGRLPLFPYVLSKYIILLFSVVVPPLGSNVTSTGQALIISVAVLLVASV